ncbi:hypothetical protein TNCV_501501 [Trichonephila clavipes]|nr:hypothetical protein TNCV_501501 [Trichonephila clavipes]
MVSWDYSWPTLRCRREAVSEPAPVNRLVVPLRSLRRDTAVSAVPGFLPDDRHTASLVGLVVGGGTPE